MFLSGKNGIINFHFQRVIFYLKMTIKIACNTCHLKKMTRFPKIAQVQKYLLNMSVSVLVGIFCYNLLNITVYFVMLFLK